jgi:predicted nucleic acid-binding protein
MVSKNKMTDVFLDTGYVLALVNQRDEHHQKAQELAGQIISEEVPVVTTQAVLTEIGNALAHPQNRPRAISNIEELRTSPDATVVPSLDDLFQRGLALYKEREDKSWGLTDCISFVVMREQGIRDALAHDEDFEQAGCNALLRE